MSRSIDLSFLWLRRAMEDELQRLIVKISAEFREEDQRCIP